MCPESRPLVSLSGGGIFFWWQVGALLALQEDYDMSQVSFVGASAGALAATLAVCQVDFRRATDLAYSIAEEADIWTQGFRNIWGSLVRTWLEALIPEDAVRLCNSSRLHVVVLEVPFVRWKPISEFVSRQEIIDFCLASVHIPYFLDGKAATQINSQHMIDGSILLKYPASLLGSVDLENQELRQGKGADMTVRQLFVLKYTEDEVMSRKPHNWLKAINFDDLQDLIHMGFMFIKRAELDGRLKPLEEVKRPQRECRSPICGKWAAIEQAWEGGAQAVLAARSVQNLGAPPIAWTSKMSLGMQQSSYFAAKLLVGAVWNFGSALLVVLALLHVVFITSPHISFQKLYLAKCHDTGIWAWYNWVFTWWNPIRSSETQQGKHKGNEHD
mmetsp:Transcript_42664/g.79932  ORF Transcript_42664/g.79932 Transcript_42664/m.79932 type:complete len:387 (+) Transcript_42664:88-1248(+)